MQGHGSSKGHGAISYSLSIGSTKLCLHLSYDAWSDGLAEPPNGLAAKSFMEAYIQQCRITGSILPAITQCSVSVHVHCWLQEGPINGLLVELSALESLAIRCDNINSCRSQDQGLVRILGTLSGCMHLHSLALDDGVVNSHFSMGAYLAAIAKLKQLRSLSLGWSLSYYDWGKLSALAHLECLCAPHMEGHRGPGRLSSVQSLGMPWDVPACGHWQVRVEWPSRCVPVVDAVALAFQFPCLVQVEGVSVLWSCGQGYPNSSPWTDTLSLLPAAFQRLTGSSVAPPLSILWVEHVRLNVFVEHMPPGCFSMVRRLKVVHQSYSSTLTFVAAPFLVQIFAAATHVEELYLECLFPEHLLDLLPSLQHATRMHTLYFALSYSISPGNQEGIVDAAASYLRGELAGSVDGVCPCRSLKVIQLGSWDSFVPFVVATFVV